MNTLTLDPTDKRFSTMAECEDGETETITVTGTVSHGKDGSLILAVEKAESSETPEEEAGESEKEGGAEDGAAETDSDMASMKKPSGPAGPDHSAVMILVGKKPK